MVDEILRTKFNKGAKSYDRQRGIVIPNLDQLYTVMENLANSNVSRPRILDIRGRNRIINRKDLQKIF